jgi:paraquat-inducible protein B
VELEATLELVPERLGITDSDDPEAATLDLLAAGVRRGMRAKLAREGLLRPSLFVDIVEDPEADPGEFDRDADPFPVVPTVPPESSDLLGSAEGVMQRVAALPIEDIMQSVLTVLANVNALIASEKVQSIPADVGQAVDDLRALIGSEELQQAPAELTAILRSVRAVIDEVTTEQLVTSLAAAVEDARGAIQNVGAATEGLPDLLDQIEGLTGEVRTLPLDQMVETATDMVASVDALVQSEAVAGLPAEVEGAIGDVRLILQDLRTGGAITNVSATLASLRQITDEVAAAEITAKLDGLIADVRLASGNLSTASEDLPQLLDSLTTLSDEAATLPLDELVASAAGVMDSASAFLGSEGVEGVAPQLSAALQEFQLLLAELREGGAAQNVNATLASADKAAQAVADASAELPALVEQLDRAASTATATLTSVGPGSQLNRDTTQLINELRSAARSVDSLASALERRPNSVLFGR